MRCKTCGFRIRNKHHILGRNHLDKIREIGVLKTRIEDGKIVKRVKNNGVR